MVKYSILIILILMSYCKKEEEKKLPNKAIVSLVVGDAIIQTEDKKEIKAAINFVVFPKDKIITSKDSFLDLQINEDVKIRIKENTVLVLESIFLNEKENKISANFKLEKGKVYSKITKKLSKDSSFQIKTRTYVAGVRGTEFIAEENPNSSKTLVSEGSVSIDLLDKEGKPIGKEIIIENGNKGICVNNTISEKKLNDEEIKELDTDSKTISSIKTEAMENINKIIKTLDDQKSINEKVLNSQKEKNKEELNQLNENNSNELNKLNQINKENLEEIKTKSISDKVKMTSEQNSEREKIQDSAKETKSKSNSELEELKNKNKENLPPK